MKNLYNWQLYCYLSLALWAQTSNSWAIQLQFPVHCVLGVSCYIQHYVDIQPSSPEFEDFAGGRLTYDGHTGTDIAIATYQKMRDGVLVLSAQRGTVLRTRDGEPNRYRGQVSDLKTKQCGNGIVISHQNGFETQYCHLKPHSLRVKPGDNVTAGQAIAEIGASGKADFPHLHFVLRHHNDVVDPFQFRYWHPNIPYQKTGLIDMGLADKAMEARETWDNPSYLKSISPPQAMVAWVRIFGIDKHDQQKFVFYQPNGQRYRQPVIKLIPKAYKEWFSYAGFPLKTGTQIPEGVWRAEYHLKKANRQWQQLGELSFTVKKAP